MAAVCSAPCAAPGDLWWGGAGKLAMHACMMIMQTIDYGDHKESVQFSWFKWLALPIFLSACCPLRRMPWHGVFPVCSGGGWCVYGMIFSMGPLVWHRVSTLVLGGDQQSARLLVISAEVPYLFQSYLWIDCHRIDCDGSSEISEEPMAYDQTSFDTSIRSEICFF